VVRLQALGVDPDDDCLTYTWSASSGALTAQEGSVADWQAPNQPGQYQIAVSATDPQGGAVVGQVVINVAANSPFDRAPSLEEITASDVTPTPGQVVQLTARASDPDGDALQNWFHFYNAAGARVGPFDVLWQAPSQPGIYRAYGVVSDNRGGFGFNIRELSVNSAQSLNRSHPSYGRAGQVLIDSLGRLLWVGINDPAVAQQGAAVGIEDGAAAGGQHQALLGGQFTDYLGFAAAEALLALDFEDPRDGGAGPGLDLVVRVNKGQTQLAGKDAAYGGLSRPHQSDQKNITAVSISH
jgi:hypothetical protein